MNFFVMQGASSARSQVNLSTAYRTNNTKPYYTTTMLILFLFFFGFVFFIILNN